MAESNIYEQSGTAISFLEHLERIENGFADIPGRALSAKEAEVKYRALTLLHDYFMMDFSKRKSGTNKSKSSKKESEKVSEKPPTAQ